MTTPASTAAQQPASLDDALLAALVAALGPQLSNIVAGEVRKANIKAMTDAEAQAEVERHQRNKEEADNAGMESEQAIAALNNRYAFVQAVGAGTAILDTQAEDADSMLVKKDVLFDRLANQNIKLFAGNDAEGKPTYTYKPAGPAWFKHKRRREYSSIVFAPGRTDIGSRYNLWQGWAYEPDENAGTFEVLKDHVLNNIAGGDPEYEGFIWDWFAAIYQDPMRKHGTALALIGGQGTGKTKLGEIMGAPLGKHYVATSDINYVLGDFTSQLEDKLLIQMEEAVWGGDKAKQGPLKDRITAIRATINRKYAPSYAANVYERYLFTSNEDRAVPVEKGDRRFAVFHVSDRNKEDGEYFGKMMDELKANDNGGFKALLHHLMTREIDWDRLRKPPRTDARAQQMVESFNPEEKWWYDLLNEGRLPGSPVNTENFVRTDDTYKSYIASANLTGAKYRSIQTIVGRRLKNWLPVFEKKDVTVRFPREGEATNPPCYRFPPLAECRTKFCEVMGADFEWDDPAAEWRVPTFWAEEREREEMEAEQQRIAAEKQRKAAERAHAEANPPELPMGDGEDWGDLPF